MGLSSKEKLRLAELKKKKDKKVNAIKKGKA